MAVVAGQGPLPLDSLARLGVVMILAPNSNDPGANQGHHQHGRSSGEALCLILPPLNDARDSALHFVLHTPPSLSASAEIATLATVRAGTMSVGKAEVASALCVVIKVQPWPHRTERMTTAYARISRLMQHRRSGASLLVLPVIASTCRAGLGPSVRPGHGYSSVA